MNEPPPSNRVLRRIGALFAGLLVVVVPSIATDAVLHATGVFRPEGQLTPDPVWLLATAYRLAYGIAGCYVAARLAPDRPMRHAVGLSLVGVAVSIVGAFVAWDKGPEFGPRWYGVAVFAIQLPCGWIGGRLQGLRASGKAT